ncbi:MAG: ABC transporter substrate-binding protein [Gordonia sp. (in: high G+C Gram-positive bacteria)]
MRARGLRRATVAATVAAATAALLVACGDKDADTLDYLIDGAVTGYNVNTVEGNASGAVMAFPRVLPGFSYLGPQGQVVADRDIGDVSLVEGPVLTVKYDFNPDAVYSDGHAMTCDDLLLAATAMGGKVPGFDASTHAGYSDIAKVDCTPGAKSATVTFARNRDYADWRALFGVGTLLPAHVVAEAAGLADVTGPIQKNDKAALAKIAKAWNTAFALKPGESVDSSKILSSGPYRVSEYSTGGGLKLVVNDKWWGARPATPTVTVWPRGTDGARQLADGHVDVTDTADVAAADKLAGKADDGAPNRVAAKDPKSPSVTQLLLAEKGVFAADAVRRAFAACVPRDTIARKHGANGLVWNLRTVAPADPLGPALNAEFARRFPRADVVRARNLLKDRPGGKPTVRIAYVSPDPVAAAVVADITETCGSAGVTVTDVASPSRTIGSLGRDADVLLVSGATGFAAAGTASGFPDAYGLYTGDPLNVTNFRSPAVTGALNDLSLSTSDSARLPLMRTVENAAWDRLPSIPLYGSVRGIAHSTNTHNVVPGLSQTGTGWNMDRWVQHV